MADTHLPPTLKEQNRVLEDMYERVRLLNLRLEKRLAEAMNDAKHLQDVVNAKDEVIRELREQLKPSAKR